MGNVFCCIQQKKDNSSLIRFLENKLRQKEDEYARVVIEAGLSNHKLETTHTEISQLSIEFSRLEKTNKHLTCENENVDKYAKHLRNVITEMDHDNNDLLVKRHNLCVLQKSLKSQLDLSKET